MPLLMAELAMDDDFTEVLFRLMMILILFCKPKTRRNKILKQDEYFERVVSLYNREDFRSFHC